MIYLLVPYLWYVRMNTKVNIIWDENIKSPQPYITPRGTASRTQNECLDNGTIHLTESRVAYN